VSDCPRQKVKPFFFWRGYDLFQVSLSIKLIRKEKKRKGKKRKGKERKGKERERKEKGKEIPEVTLTQRSDPFNKRKGSSSMRTKKTVFPPSSESP